MPVSPKLSFIKSGEFLEQVGDFQFLKDSAQWRYYLVAVAPKMYNALEIPFYNTLFFFLKILKFVPLLNLAL